jgi:hypothetical protein
MKIYGTYVRYYTIEVEVPDNANTEEQGDAIIAEIDSLRETNTIDDYEVDASLESITDEKGNYVWEI